MKQKTATEILTELADRESIRDCLMRYCRGVDRLDIEMLKEVYWPDSIDDHILFKGSGEKFIEFVEPILAAMHMTMHKLGNIFIEIDGNIARVESYFDATHVLPDDNGVPYDLVLGGRRVVK